MTISTAAPLTAADKAWEEKMARLAARKPAQRTVTFVDEELVAAAEEAQRALGRAEALARSELDAKHANLKNVKERLARVTKEIPRNKLVRERQALFDEARTAADEAEVKIVLRGLGPNLYESLQAEYPPTDAQRKQGMNYNVDRFPPALISASCVDPMTPQQAASLVGGEYEILEEDANGDMVGTGEWAKVEGSLIFGEAALLFNTAASVNEGSQARLGKE